MPVPGKHADEPTTEVQGDLYGAWLDARDQAVAWGKRAADLRAKLEDQMGDNTGGTINGKVVVTYRYKDGYAIRSLVRDYPDLTQHYTRHRDVEELDVESFALVHGDILNKYRIREFRIAGDGGEAGGE